MIYLFRGSDTARVRGQAFAFVAAARKKQPDVEYIRLAREELSPETLDEISLSGGLFVKRLLILLDDPFPVSKKEAPDDAEDSTDGSLVEEKLAQLAESENAILIVAPKLSALRAKKIASKATKEYVFDGKKQESASYGGFNAALGNALASRKGDALWLELAQSLRRGDAPEMLHGLLHWKARDLMEKGSRTWSPKEARRLSLSLISVLQDSRRTGSNLAVSLEKFALTI